MSATTHKMFFSLLPTDILYEFARRLDLRSLLCVFRRLCQKTKALVDRHIWRLCRYWLPARIYQDLAYHIDTPSQLVYARLRRYFERVPLLQLPDSNSGGECKIDTTEPTVIRITKPKPADFQRYNGRRLNQTRDFQVGDTFRFLVTTVNPLNDLHALGLSVLCNCHDNNDFTTLASYGPCVVTFDMGGMLIGACYPTTKRRSAMPNRRRCQPWYDWVIQQPATCTKEYSLFFTLYYDPQRHLMLTISEFDHLVDPKTTPRTIPILPLQIRLDTDDYQKAHDEEYCSSGDVTPHPPYKQCVSLFLSEFKGQLWVLHKSHE